MPEVEERAAWGSKLDFILSALGYAVGLGNVWRFPYMCGKNGGAAFLIPYVLMMIFAGFPMFYMELALGQFSGVPPHMLYRRMSPIFQGLGYAMLIAVTYTSLYYNMVIGWAFYYFVQSFKKDLPFADCGHSWNTDACFAAGKNKTCVVNNGTYCLGQCFPNVTVQDYCPRDLTNLTMASTIAPSTTTAIATGLAETFPNITGMNFTACCDYLEPNFARNFPAQEYWNNRVLGITSGINDIGTPRLELVGCLAIAWIIIFLTLAGGIKTAGKAVYFTATFPYVIMVALIIRGVTLDGSIEGINFYIIPDMSHLKDANVWSDACSQIFFSLSVAMGGLPTLASYNQFDNNILRDSCIVVMGNCLTSFMCGFAIFPIIGHLAKQVGQPVSALAAQGVGLTFIAYPAALAEIPLPQLFSVLFFVMLLLLGICTEQVNVETIMTAIIDEYPQLREKKRRALATFIVCFLFFIAGLVLTCPGGAYVVELLDHFAAGVPLIFIALLEVVLVTYVYGLKNFLKDVQLMLGMPPNRCWAVCGYPVNIYWVMNWTIITPAMLIFVIAFTVSAVEPYAYDATYTYPPYAQTIGWCISLSSLIPVIGFAIYRTHLWIHGYMIDGTNPQLFHVTDEWKPQKSQKANSSVYSVEEGKSDDLEVEAIKDFQNIHDLADKPGSIKSNGSGSNGNGWMPAKVHPLHDNDNVKKF